MVRIFKRLCNVLFIIFIPIKYQVFSAFSVGADVIDNFASKDMIYNLHKDNNGVYL